MILLKCLICFMDELAYLWRIDTKKTQIRY
jgi:hypothetical protein